MTRIEFAQNEIQIDAAVVAEAFRIDAHALKQRLRDGAITSQFENGIAEDAGKVRLKFFSVERQVCVTADAGGNILACAVVDLASPSSLARNIIAEGAGSAAAALEARLDQALEATFPASDPIALRFDAPAPRRPVAAKAGKR